MARTPFRYNVCRVKAIPDVAHSSPVMRFGSVKPLSGYTAI